MADDFLSKLEQYPWPAVNCVINMLTQTGQFRILDPLITSWWMKNRCHLAHYYNLSIKALCGSLPLALQNRGCRPPFHLVCP